MDVACDAKFPYILISVHMTRNGNKFAASFLQSQIHNYVIRMARPAKLLPVRCIMHPNQAVSLTY